MRILGLQKTTLLDYPNKLASIIFTGGCNMKCPYCQNAELISPSSQGFPTEISQEEIFSHLKKRQHTLEGLVISGGECTLQKVLEEFCKKVRELNLDIKIDTNGTNPKLLQNLVEKNLVQYVAMDIKNSKEKYNLTVGMENFDLTPVEESVTFLLENSVDYEFRTTVVSPFHTEEDFHSIGGWIQGAKAYYIQPFQESDHVPSKELSTPSNEELLRYKEIMTTYVQNTNIRGIDL